MRSYTRAGRPGGRGLLVVFFAIFLLMGAGFLYGFFVRPAVRILAAKQWPEVPCTIVSSEVQSHRGDDGTTYSVAITYAYEVDGQEYQSERYQFMEGSSSGYAGKRAVVEAHPPGGAAVCYVNPADPADAVLERGWTPELWFGLIPLVFVGVGAGGLVFVVRGGRPGQGSSTILAGSRGAAGGARGGAVTGLPAGTGGPAGLAAGEPVELAPRTAPWMKVMGTALVALFWNGIVSVFVVQAIRGWRSGEGDWFLTVFMIPFVAVGLGLVGAVGYFLLALFNPRPQLRVTPGVVRLGERLRVEWRFTGRTDVLQRVSVWLEGREEASYRRGTRTSTDRNMFARFALADVTARSEFRLGTGAVVLPPDTMHSFASANNKINWALRVRGEIAFWPDVNEEFPMTVLPLMSPGGTAS